MKTFVPSLGFALMLSVTCAYGGSTHDQTHDPCFSVNIQNDSVNRSNVQQSCDRNISRTVQAGQDNWTQTIQTGRVNDNKVKQYQYDRSKYFDRTRGK